MAKPPPLPPYQSRRYYHPDHQGRPPIPQPRRNRLWLLPSLIVVGGVVAMLGIAGLVAWMTPTPPVTDQTDEQYYFADSRYQGIRSKFITRRSAREVTSIEYPITQHQTINRILHQTIDRDDADFRRATTTGTGFAEPMRQTISYQVSLNNDHYLSIVVLTKQDTHGAHPAEVRHFWTFDVKEGRALSVSDLVGHDQTAAQRVLAAVRSALAAKLARRNHQTPPLNEVTLEQLSGFVVNSRASLGFPFGPGALLPSAYGDTAVEVPVNEIAPALQTPLAKALFDVPTPPQPAPPPPQPKAAASGGACAQHACVALTFDDGPSAYTPRLLDILDQYQAKATFYVLGSKVDRSTEVLKRAARAGHQIGNHTWGHPDLTRLGPDAIDSELTRTNQAIQRAIGQLPTTLRPPYGANNATIMARAGQLGMSAVMWSVDTRDWADRNTSVVCSRAVAGARPGAIILLHDIHATSVEAVPCIAGALQKQGYRLVTIDQLIGNRHPGQTYTNGG